MSRYCSALHVCLYKYVCMFVLVCLLWANSRRKRGRKLRCSQVNNFPRKQQLKRFTNTYINFNTHLNSYIHTHKQTYVYNNHSLTHSPTHSTSHHLAAHSSIVCTQLCSVCRSKGTFPLHFHFDGRLAVSEIERFVIGIKCSAYISPS